MSETTIINGFVPEWAEVRIDIQGETILGIKAIDFDTDSDGADVQGTSNEAIARTVGVNKHSASIELYLPEYSRLLAKLGPNYRKKPFDITVSYGAAESPAVMTAVLVQCLIKRGASSHQQGADGLTKKVDLRPFRIKETTVGGVFVPGIVSSTNDPFA